MSANYKKYKAMTDEQLQAAIDKRAVTVSYLNWLGITGPGKQLSDAVKETKSDG